MSKPVDARELMRLTRAFYGGWRAARRRLPRSWKAWVQFVRFADKWVRPRLRGVA